MRNYIASSFANYSSFAHHKQNTSSLFEEVKMQKLSLLASVALVAVMNIGPTKAQTWSLPANSTATAPAGKSETDLLAEALHNLENAQKLNARPEIEAAIKALAAVVKIINRRERGVKIIE